MPKVLPDVQLYNALEAVVESASGNESEAARRLGITRLKVNRVRKSRGGVTPAVRLELWSKLERLALHGESAGSKDTYDTKEIQIVKDVPGVALQVLRYMTGIIERDIGREERSHAH